MPDLPLDPVQVLALREAFGVPPGARDPDADDLLAVLTAEQVLRAEAARIRGETGLWGDG